MTNYRFNTTIAITVMMAALFTGIHCSGGEEKLSVGETAELIVDDQKIGMIEQVSETERHLLIDRDQDGVVEKRIIIDGETVTRIAYPQTDTNMAKEVIYEGGVPVKVNVSENETLKGVAMLENENVSSVELPGYGKKITYSEGSIAEILELENKEPAPVEETATETIEEAGE